MIDEPLLTRTIDRSELHLSAGDVYIYGTGVEDRSVLDSPWRDQMTAAGAEFFWVDEDFGPSELELRSPMQQLKLATRSTDEMLSFFGAREGRYYIDITGLTYSAWAPMIKAAIESRCTFDVIYVEPADYQRSKSPATGMLFELSEELGEVGALPGLTRFRRFDRDDWVLVAFLGFEGSRFAHVIETLQPPNDGVVPVVGLPGFRPEFVTTALISNRSSLDNMSISGKLRYATANCPFDTFQTIYRIQSDFSDRNLRLAPIGTKPHGLGAVLYGLSRPDRVQVVYDHPIRKAKRTIGLARVCHYQVSTFCESDLFRAV